MVRAKLSKSLDSLCWVELLVFLPWRKLAKPPRRDCHNVEHLETEVPNFVASSNHLEADSNCYPMIDCSTRVREHCCSRSKNRTARMSMMRSNRARSNFDKAPDSGACPLVRQACSLPRCLCTQYRRYFWRDDDVCHLLWSSGVEEAAAVAVSCYVCCSYTDTGLPSFRYRTTKTAMLSRSLDVDRKHDSENPVNRKPTFVQSSLFSHRSV